MQQPTRDNATCVTASAGNGGSTTALAAPLQWQGRARPPHPRAPNPDRERRGLAPGVDRQLVAQEQSRLAIVETQLLTEVFARLEQIFLILQIKLAHNEIARDGTRRESVRCIDLDVLLAAMVAEQAQVYLEQYRSPGSPAVTMAGLHELEQHTNALTRAVKRLDASLMAPDVPPPPAPVPMPPHAQARAVRCSGTPHQRTHVKVNTATCLHALHLMQLRRQQSERCSTAR